MLVFCLSVLVQALDVSDAQVKAGKPGSTTHQLKDGQQP
jgi:hypothetical protein